ncbi:MAG: hypothetical protein AAFZ52_15730 [Bacteroidota bacterium]
MTRTYALSLIAIALLIIASLLYGQRQWLKQEQIDFLTLTETVQDRAIAQKVERLEMMEMRFEELLEDESKAKFRPLFSIFAAAAEQRSWYLEEVKACLGYSTKSICHEFLPTGQRSKMLELEQAAAKVLREHYEDFDLNEEEMRHRLKAYQNYRKELLIDYTPQNYERPLFQKLLALQLLSFQEDLLLDVTSIFGGRALVFDRYYPVVIDDMGVVYQGEKRATKIAIGSFFTDFSPENITLRVNGEELQIGDDGTAPYFFPSKLRGNRVLDMEVLITNPLTGQVMTEQSTYHYEVR